ncbi:insulin receptor substrate 1-like, partial [Rhagoletis pomonella]
EERPKRSYSIGSKIDKNKIKRFGNSNEILHDTNAVRVRAFSVGSRAKIPKCDLQRAVMFPRSRLNQSCISNNSLNFGTDEAGHKSDLNSSCGKKSTSAPILVQNCPVPMDYMSDLMEIDFSKSASHKGHGKGALERVDSCLHELKGHLTSKYESDFSGPLSLKSKDCRESGYLEMKPIDCVIDKKTAASYSECLVKMPKLNDNSTVTFVKRTEIKNTAQGKNVPARKSLNTLNEVSFNQIKGRLKESDYSTCGNIDYLSSIYSNLWIQPSSNNHSEEEKGFAELDVKLPKKEYNTKIISENLQNNSEYLKENGSSEQRSTGIMEKYLNFASSSSMSSGQLSSRCKSSSVNPFNDGQTAITVEGNRENENLLRNFPIDYKPQITNVSISALDCYNYELYYAKLDLPQSCSKEDVKFHKTENDLSPIVNTDNDSYAKINFEHSSDSSSSSKTINN